MTRSELVSAIAAFDRPPPVMAPFRAMRDSLAAGKVWDDQNPREASERYALMAQLEQFDQAAREAERTTTALKRTGAGDESLAVLSNPNPTPALTETRAWLDEQPASWALVLRGPVGTGKTIAARWALAETVRRSGCAAEYRRTSEVLRISAFEAGARELHALKRIAFLVLDDVGAENLSDYGRGILLELFDARYELRPSARTVLTANPPWPDLEKRLGQRIVDRIRHGGRVVELDGASMRGRMTTSGLPAAGAPLASALATAAAVQTANAKESA